MDNVDGTDHYTSTQSDLPSLLVIILDTNPLSWHTLANPPPESEGGSLSFQTALSELLIFANAHLAFSHANRAAVIASHITGAHFLSPASPDWIRPEEPKTLTPEEAKELSAQNARKYRTFRLLEDEVRASVKQLIADTTVKEVDEYGEHTSISGALALALAYINRNCFGDTATKEKAVADEKAAKVTAAGGVVDESGRTMHAKILVVSVTPDPASQYISVMNSIFAAQRMKVPIDVLKLLNPTVFLQQAADATGGVYMQPDAPAGMLQYLMMAFLPDHVARKYLILPTKADVDFRAACFCHKRVMDIGFVCSVCLSIFCEPPINALCMTCGVKLDLSSLQNAGKPVVLKKKKKKKAAGGSLPASGVASAADSPAPSV